MYDADKFKPSITVHPHVCGEHINVEALRDNNDGSSPRVWGTCCMVFCKSVMLRFIPTCVGNITLWHKRPCRLPVHPHVCGEHVKLRYCNVPFVGSSPRVWGTLMMVTDEKGGRRFIPTCVGNIFPHSFHRLPQAVHPHVCGEHSTI